MVTNNSANSIACIFVRGTSPIRMTMISGCVSDEKYLDFLTHKSISERADKGGLTNGNERQNVERHSWDIVRSLQSVCTTIYYYDIKEEMDAETTLIN